MDPTLGWTFDSPVSNRNYYDEMEYKQNTNETNRTFEINRNNTDSDAANVLHHPIVSLAYSGYKKDLAPWLTCVIFALVVFVILIPAFCSACYHYYR